VTSAEHLETAAKTEAVIAFSYPSSVDGQPVRRTLSPWQFEKGGTVLMGWDHDRERPRRYSLDKIEDMDWVLNESFVHPE
jgi:proteasome accessory factor B